MVRGCACRRIGFTRRGIRLWRIRRARIWGKAARTEEPRSCEAALVLVGGWNCDCYCARFVMLAVSPDSRSTATGANFGRTPSHGILTGPELGRPASLERGVHAASTCEWKRAGANRDLVG